MWCNGTGRPTGRGGSDVTGSERWSKIKTQLLTSFAATLFDPFGVGDVVVTSLAVVKCSETAQWVFTRCRFCHRCVCVCTCVLSGYLFTSLASLAIKNPSVPSCILTWFPGLIRMLGIQRNRHRVQINPCTSPCLSTPVANQEEWYTLGKLFIFLKIWLIFQTTR